MAAFLLMPCSPGAESRWRGAVWSKTAAGRVPARMEGQPGVYMCVSLCPPNPSASLHQHPSGVSVTSTPICPTPPG